MTRRSLAVVAAGVLALPAATARGFELEQVGCLPSGALRGDVVLSGDGTTAVFVAAADLVPGANPLGIPQAFALDLRARSLRQLTAARLSAAADAATCGAVEASVAHDGGRVVIAIACGIERRGQRWRLLDRRGGVTRPLGRWTRCAPRVHPQAVSGDGRMLLVSAACNPAPRRSHPDSRGRHRLWMQERPGRPLRPFGPAGRCDTLAPALDATADHAAFLSDCDPSGENPTHAMNLFTLTRTTGAIRQRTHAAHLEAGGRCGVLQAGGRIRSGLFDTPALAAAGDAFLPAPCVGEADPGSVLRPRLWRFPAGGGSGVELPVAACALAPALWAYGSPASPSADGRRVALVRSCAAAADLTAGEQALLIAGPATQPVSLLANAGFQVAVRREIRRPSLDAAGTTLLVASGEPPPGCRGAGDLQLLVARDVDDPVLRRVTCGCGTE